MSEGVVYVAYGLRARQEVEQAVKFLRQHNDLPVTVVGERVNGLEHIGFDDSGSGRWAKLNLDQISPYEYTVYLDADTRVHGDISAGLGILHDSWDIAISPSTKQGTDLLWHVDLPEREATFLELGKDSLVQLQGGVIFFRKSPEVHALFGAWREEWQRWRGQDQAALLRALYRCPVRLWLLSNEWNGGYLIEHRYGAARRRERWRMSGC